MIDNETQKILSIEEKIRSVVEHEGWEIIRARWMDKVMDLQSIRNVLGNTPENVAIDVKARLLAVDTLLEWMRDIEGTAEKSVSDKDVFKRDNHIVRL